MIVVQMKMLLANLSLRDDLKCDSEASRVARD